MKMYVDNTRDWIIPTRVDGPRLTQDIHDVAEIDVLVSTDGAGTTVALANRSPDRQARCTILLEGEQLHGAYEAELLDGSSPDAFNSVEHPDAVVPRNTVMKDEDGVFSLPPHALCILKIAG